MGRVRIRAKGGGVTSPCAKSVVGGVGVYRKGVDWSGMENDVGLTRVRRGGRGTRDARIGEEPSMLDVGRNAGRRKECWG
eukprot:759021-Hanusia_phi.AAC.3